MRTTFLTIVSLWTSSVVAAPLLGKPSLVLPASGFTLETRLERRDNDISFCAGNTADDRSVWCEYDTDTNYYETWPETGVIREFWFELTNTTAAPDGVDRIVLSVNGSIPGPTIEVNWYGQLLLFLHSAFRGTRFEMFKV